MPYALWFQKAGKEALNLVGGKNASLGELIRADIPVPPGFSVTTEAYQDFLIEGGIKEKIGKILSPIGLQDVASLEEASKAIRELIRTTPLPKGIEEVIRSNYQALSQVCEVTDITVAVALDRTATGISVTSQT